MEMQQAGWDHMAALKATEEHIEFLAQYGHLDSGLVRETFYDVSKAFGPAQYDELIQREGAMRKIESKVCKTYGDVHPVALRFVAKRQGYTLRADYLARVYPSQCH